jgi:hypothetical protein
MSITALTKKSYTIFQCIVIVTLVLFPLTFGVHTVKASALTPIKDVISDSRPSEPANHTISFTTPTGIPADGSTIQITFPSGFTVPSIGPNDVDLAYSGDDHTDAADCSGSEEMSVSTSGQIVTLEICSGKGGAIALGGSVVIEIGDHTSESGTNQVTNHGTANVYDIDIGGSMDDSGTAQIVIVDTLTARVTVDQTMSFTIGTVDLATCADRDDKRNEVATTSATLVDFGSITAEQFYDACHSMTVGTNAANGYTVTVTESDQLTYGTDTIADGNCDATCSEINETTWTTETNNGFGYCLDDITGDGAATADSGMTQCSTAGVEFKIFPELDVDTPEYETVMSSAGSLSANDVTHLGYRVTVPGSTPAGVYENNIILVATPIY